MKSNKLICLIIGILIGSLLKAEAKSPSSGHRDRFLAAVQVSHDEANRYIEDNASFKCKLPNHKSRKIRPRFRGVSFFTLQQISSATQSDNSFYVITTSLPTGNLSKALPFYYIFLFRLTPF